MRCARIKFPVIAVTDDRGVILRMLESPAAANSWIRKHFPGKTMRQVRYGRPFAVRKAFDEQMRLGLTDTKVIDDLLWYGGVSSTKGKLPEKGPGVSGEKRAGGKA